MAKRDREALQRAVDSMVAEQRDDAMARGREIESMHSRLADGLRAILGQEGLAEVEAAIDHERRAGQSPAGSPADRAQARRASATRIDDLIVGHGGSVDAIRTLTSEHDGRLLELAADANGPGADGYNLERNLQQWLDLSELHHSPLPWGVIGPPADPDDPHRWFVYRPPFFGFLFSFWSQATDDFQVSRDLFLDPPAGWVGHRVALHCEDGGFSDTAQARADAQIAFAFVPPVAGLLEVVIDAQSTDAAHEVDIQDRFWSSSASSHLRNYLTVTTFDTFGRAEYVAQMDDSLVRSGGDNVSVRNRQLSRLQHYFADVVSTRPVRANETVIVAVGTRSLDLVGAHCMDIQSVSDYRWFISSVEVRVVP